MNTKMLAQLIARWESGNIQDRDVDAFLKSPHLWRKPHKIPFDLADARNVWQSIYDDLDNESVHVPEMPRLTKKQTEKLNLYGFLPMFLLGLLGGRWVLVESLCLPDAVQDPNGDPLMSVAGHSRLGKRFEAIQDEVVEDVGRILGFPKRLVRLPSRSELNRIATLFNWLRERHGWLLPSLQYSAEWVRECVVVDEDARIEREFDRSCTCFRLVVEL